MKNSAITRKLQKLSKYNPIRATALAHKLIQRTDRNKILALLASQPVLWTALAPILLHHTDAKAGEPVFAPGVLKPFGLDMPATPNVSGDSIDGYIRFIQFVDIDGDGDKDIFVQKEIDDLGLSWLEDTTYFMYKKNLGTKENPNFNTPFIQSPFNLPIFINDGNLPHQGKYTFLRSSFNDFDKDGDNDLLYQSLLNDTLDINDRVDFYYCRNIGTATNPNFAAPIKNPFGLSALSIVNDNYSSSSLETVDFDKDGDLDILMISDYVLNTNSAWQNSEYEILFYKNIGTQSSPNFQKTTLLKDTAIATGNNILYANTYNLNVIDYDKDGDLDIVSLGYYINFDQNNTTINRLVPGIIFRNNSNPTKPFTGFEPLQNIQIPNLLQRPSNYQNNIFNNIGAGSFIDIDNDGDMDLFCYEPYKMIPSPFFSGDSNFVSNFFFIENLGHANNTIAGKVYLDKNKNGTQNAGEKNLPAIVINYDKTAAPAVKSFAITDSAGEFLFPALDGSYVVKPTVPKYHTAVPAQATINTADTNFFYTQDFAIQPINATTADLVGIITSGPARPGFKVPFWLTYKNVGTKAMTGSMVYTKDSRLSFVTASTAPSSQAGNNLTWNFSNLQPMESVTLYAEMQLSAGATLGDTLTNILQVTPTSGDATPQDNSDTLKATIIGSFDPNDKLVTPTGTGTDGNIPPSTSIFEYTVRFQNVGSDTAFNIVVKDSLGTNFDWSTLEILASSHPLTAVVRNSSTLKFTFDNIQLPAAVQNEPKSHGFVKYSIKPKAAQPLGSKFTNKAEVFFDYNSPVLTNTTVNTFFVATALVGKQNQTFELFPNPMNEKAILRFDNIYGEAFQFTLYTLNGNVVESRSVIGSSLEIERKSLAPGVYVFKLEGTQTMGTGRIVVQ